MSSTYNDIFNALYSGNVEYVRQLETDVLLNWRDYFDDTRSSALTLAAIYGHLSCCEDILNRCPSLLYKASKLGNTALHQASFNGRQDVLKFLLHASASVTREECRDIESSITTPDNISNKLLAMVTKDTHWTALHFAVEPGCPAPGKDHLRLAKLLLEADPSNNLLRMVDQNGDTAMHIAVRTHRLDIVKLLVETDPNFEYCINVMSQTPLSIAFQDGLTGDETAVEIRRLLIEKQPSQCKVHVLRGENKWTLLHYAAYKGDLSTIEDIIKFCPECLEFVDNDNQNFLHVAVKFENIKVVKYILELLAITDEILNGQDNLGNTPLHIAAIGKNEMIVSLFLYNSRVCKTIRNMQGERAIDMSSIYNLIYSALQYEDVENVRRLDLDVLQNWQDTFDDFRSSALSTAAIYGSLSCCEEILKRCPSLLYKASKNGYTALHQAAFNGRQEVIKFLLSASFKREECRDIESGITTHYFLTMVTKDNHLRQGTALHIALENGHLESARLLIEASNPTNNLVRMAKTDGDTAMHIAVKNHNLGIVKLLVEVDPDFEYCTNVRGQTPLFIAFQDGIAGDETSVKIRKLLIKKQPSQCKVYIGMGKNNWTLLHHATDNGDLSTIEDIIKFCPECLEIVDANEQNFLHVAVKKANIDIVKYILELSTIPVEVLDRKDNHGNTPMHIAAMGENESMTRCFLYSNRVCKTIRNMKEERAFDLITFDYDKRRAGVNGLVVGEKDIKDQTDFDLLVGALIATVSFTAGITVPGGYTSDGSNEGTAVLAKKLSFKVFLIANTIALLLSLYAVFCHFCVKRLSKKENIIYRLKVATYCSFGSIFAMVVAFITGSYVVLAVTEEFSITVCVLCCCFFIFAFGALWEMLMDGKPSRRSQESKSGGPGGNGKKIHLSWGG